MDQWEVNPRRKCFFVRRMKTEIVCFLLIIGSLPDVLKLLSRKNVIEQINIFGMREIELKF